MQDLKEKFLQKDQTKLGTLQSCIRTNDLDLVGDGSHLTYFEMLGNFSFGRGDYSESIQLWHEIITDLQIPVTHITFHPDRPNHQKIWENLGYQTKPDFSCQWSDGNIGGYCCEMFVGDLEIGNLVNTLDHSTDVGFGYERLLQVYENKLRVDEISLFDQQLNPIARDHKRTLEILWENGIMPGGKGRHNICRKLLRRYINNTSYDQVIFKDWIEQEKKILQSKEKLFNRYWKKYQSNSFTWWHETFGLSEDEINLFKTKHNDS